MENMWDRNIVVSVSSLNGISTWVGYLMQKPSFLKKNSRRDKGFHIFYQGISQKMDVIARLEFELTYNNVAYKHVNHFLQVFTKLILVVAQGQNIWALRENQTRR